MFEGQATYAPCGCQSPPWRAPEATAAYQLTLLPPFPACPQCGAGVTCIVVLVRPAAPAPPRAGRGG